MAKNFSDKFISNLKPRDKTFTLREAKGFTLKVSPTGCKTFLYIYEADGKRKQLNLGVYPYVSLADARRKYTEAVTALERGEPLTKTPSHSEGESILVRDLIREYMSDSKKDDGTDWSSQKESVYKNKLKDWHEREVESITRKDALRLVDLSREQGDGAMRNLYKMTRALFEYAVNHDYIAYNPFGGLKKVKPALRNKERARFLTEEEIAKVWQGIEKGGGTEVTKRVLKLILLTAQRPGEVVGMHRREIEGDWWVLPAERVKTRNTHRVFLTKTAKDLIGDSDGFIFPTPKKSASGHISDISVAQRVAVMKCYGVPQWTPHDLRRTARTHMSRIRIPREHAEAVLNHAKGGVVKVYDQYLFDDEKREALQAWEAELLRLSAQAMSSE